MRARMRIIMCVHVYIIEHVRIFMRYIGIIMHKIYRSCAVNGRIWDIAAKGASP